MQKGDLLHFFLTIDKIFSAIYPVFYCLLP